MMRLRMGVMLVCLGALLAAGAGRAPGADPVRMTVVTFNILVDLSRPPGLQKWPDRREPMVRLLRDAKPDVMGLQEPSPNQFKYLREEFSDFTPVWYQEGRSEYTDVILFFRKDRFKELEHGHFWLSPTPDKKFTSGFGNTLPRIVVWAKLADQESGREFYAINTHFDNSQPSQERMAELCEREIPARMDMKLPMLFIGDFNTHQTRGDYPKLTSNGWRDAYTVSPKAGPDGKDENVPTFSDKRIDHIFYRGEGLVPVLWERLEWADPGQPLSDHQGVRAQFEWR
jgi:endonuclease/exonuclease/phosphatase family metal-dependent hydrolase